MYDVVEDVYQDSFYVVVGQDDFECFGYVFFGCIVVNVEEVGWFVVVQVDDVYGIYGQVGVVDYVVDVVFQCDVVQFLFLCMGFMGVVLGWVVYGVQFWLMVQGVVVDVDFGIQVVQVVVFFDYQWVYFQQGQVVVLEQFCQVDEDMGELFDLVVFQVQLEGQFVVLVWLCVDQWVDGSFEDFFGSVVGDFFDVYVIFGGSYEYDVVVGMIDDGVEVQFFVDVGVGFYQDFVDWLVVGVGLVGYQVFVQLLLGECFGVFFVFYQFYIVCFIVVVGVYLSFDDLFVVVDFVVGFCGFFGGVYGKVFGYRQVVFSEQLFILIFVEIYVCLLLFVQVLCILVECLWCFIICDCCFVNYLVCEKIVWWYMFVVIL